MAETRIDIRLPLPLSVVGALTAAIGTMWPTAKIVVDPHFYSIVIPDHAAKRASIKRLHDIVKETEADPDDPDAVLNHFTNDGAAIGLDSRDERWLALAGWAHAVLTTLAAVNYVEQEVKFQDDSGVWKKLVVTACWSKEQTPHAIRKHMEAERDTVQLELDRLRARLADQNLPEGMRVGDQIAALDQIRQLVPRMALRSRQGNTWWTDADPSGTVTLRSNNGWVISTPTTAKLALYTPFTILAGPAGDPGNGN